ncbi:MAG: hypothetical protein M3R36_10385 [Bacteroidota bacterium]|nr:hypothetical protein [Bacteroidota bacterium]
MKAIKMLQAIIVISVFTILTGCSEETISPVGISNDSVEVSDPAIQDDIPVNVYHSVIRIKPKKSYTFDFSNTGLYSFNSISVFHPEISRKLFEIVAYMDDEVILLDNNSSGFFVRSITIQNLTSRFIDLTVVLKGSNVPVKDPKGITTNEE